jgi:PAS domain S-box-containing protein
MIVLAIDGNRNRLAALRAMMADVLPEARVLAASDGQDGLALARAEDPDVILLGTAMPGMDGCGICRALKGDPSLDAIPALFLTGPEIDSGGRAEALAAGAEGFLSTPFDALELTAQLRAMVKIKAGAAVPRAKAAWRASERALQESEERFRAFFERAPLGYQSLDADGTLVEVNEAWLETLGYTREEVIGRWFGDFLSPECVQEFRERFSAFKAKGRAHSEFYMLHKNGDRRYVAFDGRISRRPDGSFQQTHCILADHTERKRAETALRASEAHYRTLVENIPQRIFIKDRSFRWVAANENLLRDFGLSLDETIGKEDYELFPKELADKYRADDRRIMETGETEEFEERYVRGKKQRWASTVKTPVRGDNGEIIGVFGISWDITERKQAEMVQQASEARLRRAQEIAHVGDWELTVGSGAMWASHEAFRIFGLEYAAEGLALARVQAMAVPEDRQRMDAALRALLQERRPYDEEFRILRASDGAQRVIHSVANVECDPDGEPLKVVGIIQDITGRRQAEAAVRASEERLQDIISNMGGWVWEMDGNGRCTYMSQKGVDLLGVPLEDILGKTPFDFMSPDEAERVAARYSEIMGRKAPIVDLDYWIVGPDGERIDLLSNAFPILDEQGTLIGYRGVDRDITERKQAERCQLLSSEILGILNEPIPFADAIGRTLAAIKRQTGFDAVGLRLKDGDDFPYFSQDGFSDEFIEAESSLAERDANGDVCRNADGSVCLGCTCGLVISGKADPAHPLFSDGGSFYTNDSLPLLDLTPEEDPRSNPRNRCIHDGYASVALIPVRANREIVGLLHLNDRRKNRFTLRQIQFLEGVCTSIGIALVRNRVQEQLRASERSYRNQFAMNSSVMLLIDPADGAILDANAAALDFYGYSRTQLLAMRIADINTLPAAEVRQAMGSVPEERGGQFQFQHRLADGSIRDVRVSSSRIHIGERTVLHSIVSDITDRKRTETELRRTRAILQAAMDQSPAGIAIADAPDGALRYVNNAGLFIRGEDRQAAVDGVGIEQYVGRWQLFDLDGRPLEDDEVPLARAILFGEACSREFVIRRTADDWRTVLANAAPIRDEEENVVAAIVVFVDITDRKQAERKWRASDELLRKLSAQVPGAIYQYQYFSGGRSCFPFASEGIRDIYEVTPDEIRQDGTKVFARLHLADRDRVITSILDSRDQLTPWSCDYRVSLPTKGVRWLRGASNPERQEDGSVIWHGYIDDITEQKQIEADREKLQVELQQARKMDAIGRLAGGVAHDFNNMLEVIIGHTEFALDDVDPSQPIHADLREVIKAARRSADLTRQLLTFARKQVISPKVLDLNEAVRGTLKMLGRLIGENIDLEWEPQQGLWPIMMDPSQLDQILANLCLNARDAIADVGAITIRAENVVLDEASCSGQLRPAPGEYVVLSVSDNGCGMDQQTVAQVFEPFFTTKEMGRGTGLGLATVYGIVQQNRGGIDVCSEPGAGTVFAIHLPRHVGTATVAIDDEAAPAPRGTETILVVEDELAILKMATRMLEGQGYTVLSAATPGEGIRLGTAHPGEIDLLLTDVIMPEMNGWDLAGSLLSLRPALSCLFMSGYTADVIAQHQVLRQGTHFIQKPFTTKGLSEKVREVLDARQGK